MYHLGVVGLRLVPLPEAQTYAEQFVSVLGDQVEDPASGRTLSVHMRARKPTSTW